MEPIKVREHRPDSWAELVNEYTPDKIRDIWRGETADTCLVIALLERLEAAEAQLTAALQEQERLKQENDTLKDAVQTAINCGLFVCQNPNAEQRGKPEHWHWCEPCLLRRLLTPGRYLKPNDELKAREDAAAQITAVVQEMRDWLAALKANGKKNTLVEKWADLLTAPARGETRQQETKEEIIAEALARMAHDGQKEESTGDPYIKHVERVVAMVEGKARVVAWLHDVLEDSDWFTAGDLRVAGISEPVVDALWLLTRFDEVPYNTYIESIRRAEHPLAIEVKLADLRDHLRPNCPERLRPRYEKAWATLTNQPLPSVSTLDGGETRRDEGRKEARKDEPR